MSHFSLMTVIENKKDLDLDLEINEKENGTDFKIECVCERKEKIFQMVIWAGLEFQQIKKTILMKNGLKGLMK